MVILQGFRGRSRQALGCWSPTLGTLGVIPLPLSPPKGLHCPELPTQNGPAHAPSGPCHPSTSPAPLHASALPRASPAPHCPLSPPWPPRASFSRGVSSGAGEGEEQMVRAEVVVRKRVPVRPPKPRPNPGPAAPASSGGSPSEVQGPGPEAPEVGVGLIRLWRPQALNALCQPLMRQFAREMAALQADPRVGAIVVTGHGKAFAAGADIAEMQPYTLPQAQSEQLLAGWEAVFGPTTCRKPVIAAVNGFALGGGCELAMMCDIILAGERAVFGQPEVALGVIPGMGGTQRLVRAVGKSRAMEMVLGGGAFLDASEAVQCGLASRVVPGDSDALVEAALELGARISSLSFPVVALAKECVSAALESTLHEGLARERAAFYSTFALEDQKEGMSAFVEKREPEFRNL